MYILRKKQFQIPLFQIYKVLPTYEVLLLTLLIYPTSDKSLYFSLYQYYILLDTCYIAHKTLLNINRHL